MATKSFTRKIEIKTPEGIAKMRAAMKSADSSSFRTPIKDIDRLIKESRTDLAKKLTAKY